MDEAIAAEVNKETQGVVKKMFSQPDMRELHQKFNNSFMPNQPFVERQEKQMNLIVSTVDGCVLHYADVINKGFKELRMLPLLKGRHEIATGIDQMCFSPPSLHKGKKDLLVGLYSKYLIRYTKPDSLLDDWRIIEIMKFDSAILSIESGDIFGIGTDVLVVLTINSIHVIAAKLHRD